MFKNNKRKTKTEREGKGELKKKKLRVIEFMLKNLSECMYNLDKECERKKIVIIFF